MAAKVRVSLTIDEALIAEAKAVGLNLSAVAEEAIRLRTRAEEMRLWAERNREALEAWDKRIEEDGLWSDGLRLF
ncbi:MAG: acetoacetyl-CoA synthase [Hyphomonas sp.]|uniref:type II toxin-antitoxin system CcdA family antitoxin n=1 Tax=Hyphomonas sp. TaxID=87 RepID=UPI0017CC61A3|nr:type II toxin-antitoxin system CcdA family antitoxin [Hyphomonas sp.]MBU3920040.1 type II toxin-antitoxin system CcdA family antitoxin [Alphaproteobacteria bacterium]MBA3069460.1 acetoacetyl-CoA synthase [Hyphomonas sp.]MBU4063842.1 type II toxin-antitoxin system CcdA family antitoxin [Alphaproteobacteria bacterium]MBU4164197.1 type II toxin-antitoxin system CcdA family antitoxin [Alphaproteobacteria bacterium]MBU4567356.1 type II toxin-antitoxin system CcdA family antitoxin [Alphaproteobac